jgi:hypothetical protein
MNLPPALALIVDQKELSFIQAVGSAFD